MYATFITPLAIRLTHYGSSDGGHHQPEHVPRNVVVRRRLFDIGDEEVRAEPLKRITKFIKLEFLCRGRAKQETEIYSR